MTSGHEDATEEREEEPRTALPRRPEDATAGGVDLIRDTGHEEHVLEGLVLDDVHHVVDRHDAEQPASFIDHRHGEHVVARHDPGHLFLVSLGETVITSVIMKSTSGVEGDESAALSTTSHPPAVHHRSRCRGRRSSPGQRRSRAAG